jgi:OOP family OmpA-OmpF porin
MRTTRTLASSLAAIAFFALPVVAQDKGTFDVGVFGRVNWLDDAYHTNTGFGGGGRLGWFFARNFEIAVDASGNSNPTNLTGGNDVSYTPVHVRLDYFVPMSERFALLIGAGYTREHFSGGGSSGSDDAIGGTVGVRMKLGKKLYALVNYTLDYASSPAASAASSTKNNGLEFGIGWYLGGKKAEAAAPAPAPTPAPAPAPAAAAPAAAAPVVVAPPADDDKDGVANTADACPNTPAGEAVDAKGCSESQKDDDHDGVMNNADKCPNTPAGTEVDKNGCRIAPLILKGVNFETAKAVLLPSASATLDTVATALLAHPTVKVQISGYTDNVGKPANNLKLSQDRADAVKAYLVSKGVPSDQVVAKGFGEENPIAPNDSDAGKASNRRVELKILSE